MFVQSIPCQEQYFCSNNVQINTLEKEQCKVVPAVFFLVFIFLFYFTGEGDYKTILYGVGVSVPI